MIEGFLAAEDEQSVTIVTGGTRLRYEKSELDLEKMKELNTNYRKDKSVKTLVVPSQSAVSSKKKDKTPLTDVAKKGKTPAATNSSTGTDLNEKALAGWVSELEERMNVTPSQQTQMQLAKAKKSLTFYKGRNEREFSKSDRRLMLEQLVNALDFNYNKALEGGAGDEHLATLKREIDKAKTDLAEVE